MRARTSPLAAVAVVALLAGALPAPAQTGSVRVNAPPTPAPPAGRITSVTLAATTPTTFRGVCSPSTSSVRLQGTFQTDISQPADKRFGNPAQFIWSDWKVDPSHVDARSDDRKTTSVDELRYFDKSFDGWVKLQVDPWKTGRPRESAQVAVKITCEPTVSNQLQHAPAGASKAPPPSTPGH
ncbi:MAG TPA: hypothetical protein VMN04_00735 [Thermoanaerobaculia bacterium]|nr:hypothetical protein [Thermoanaerobaculia bacterium]